MLNLHKYIGITKMKSSNGSQLLALAHESKFVVELDPENLLDLRRDGLPIDS